MAQYFYVAVTAERPLPTRYYSFIDDLEEMAAPVIDASLHHMSDEDKLRRESQLSRRLDGRTRGLLELKCPEHGTSGFWRGKVEFLHRTVRDFLHDSQYIQKLFEQELTEGCSSLRACEAILISWKTVPDSETLGFKLSIEDRIDEYEDLIFFGSICRRNPECVSKLQKILVAAEKADNHSRSSMGQMLRPMYFLELGASIGLYDYLEFNAKSRPQLFAPGVSAGI